MGSVRVGGGDIRQVQWWGGTIFLKQKEGGGNIRQVQKVGGEILYFSRYVCRVDNGSEFKLNMEKGL